MSRSALRILSFALFAFVFTLIADADRAGATEVVLLEDHRRVTSIGQSCDADEFGDMICAAPFSQLFEPETAFEAWSPNGQTSQVGTLAMTASGFGDAYSDYGWSEFNSNFEVVFEVVEATEVELIATGQVDSLWGGGAIEIGLIGSDGSVYYQDAAGDDGVFESFAFAGVLAPGIYEIFARTDFTPISSGSYSLDFSISVAAATPEPATAVLLGLGLMGLSARRSSL